MQGGSAGCRKREMRTGAGRQASSTRQGAVQVPIAAANCPGQLSACSVKAAGFPARSTYGTIGKRASQPRRSAGLSCL